MRGSLSKGRYSASLLANRLAEVVTLSPAERSLLTNLEQRSEIYAPGSEISPAHPRRIQPRLIVSGWAGRQRMLSNGRCQLLSILLPGDVIGSWEGRRPLDDETIVAINNVHVISLLPVLGNISNTDVNCGNILPGILHLLRAEEQRIIDSLVRMGCQTALERTANMLLELHDRCRTIGFVNGDSFIMPLTQEMMANLLGLSVVHINRIIRLLKSDGSIAVNMGEIRILDRALLEKHANSISTPLYMVESNNCVHVSDSRLGH